MSSPRPHPGSTDAPAELRRTFWALVAVFNLSLLSLAAGVLVIAFEGRITAGAAFLLVGAAAFGLGWRRYRRARQKA